MSSRWQANKIGLINFWYYDEQEYHFIKGRMLLRGSNGSGKSVTMQSVIPLLLDGNMSPERLDPFGSRDRKMVSYLLEEDDGREERTGYLYLEFRRRDSDTYMTIGMGIRARRGKPLDKWYFGLTDGRRIGRDFPLYKELDEKIPLSRKELENRLQNGGAVFDRQTDYMEFVNKQIFGFETTDEYKEMIDLLIQLRTPKLSKDFKPSVINEILSDSLQPLSDDDLRPMSEAIENMDTMNMNLKARQESLQAAEKINREFDKYNKLILFEKAECLETAKKTLLDLNKENDDCKKAIEQGEKKIQELDEMLTELDSQNAAMEKEKDSLSKSDAVGLKDREEKLHSDIIEKEAEQKNKEKQLKEKEGHYKDRELRKKEEENKKYDKRKELDGFLEDMQEEADEMSFPEHDFFAADLEKGFEADFSFDSHINQFENMLEALEEGIKLFRQIDVKERERDEKIREREKHQRETDAKERAARELDALFIQAQNEWKDRLYGWNGQNKELVISKELLRELAQFAESYNEVSDFGNIKQKVADVRIAKKGEFDTEINKKTVQCNELKVKLKEQKEQLEEWKNHKEPEPFRSDEIIRNRKRLRDMNIPYQEFYKVIEFGSNLDKEACDRLEEALAYMGILDALVIDEQYREQVLASEKGCHDQYLFVQGGRVEKSILDILEINDSVNDIFFNQTITGILGNIAYDGDGITSIGSDGTYRIGVLTGTLTGEYEAGFLGSRAREKNRQSKIAECEAVILQLETELAGLETEIHELEICIKNLEDEYNAFPGIEDLSEANRLLVRALAEVDMLREDGRKMDEKLRLMTEEIEQIKTEALKIAEKLYLAGNLETFSDAADAAKKYEKNLISLKSGHEVYIRIIQSINQLDEAMEQLDADMEQIRYEERQIKKALSVYRQEYDSVREQLRLTDYEEIKERLDKCVKFLHDYPLLLKKYTGEKGEKLEQIKHLNKQCEDAGEKISMWQKKSVFLEKCYEAEKALGYVRIPEEISGDSKHIRDYLANDCKNMEKDTIISSLNNAYFANRGYLNDYQPTQNNLFEEFDDELVYDCRSAKRLNISAKYQGAKIPFNRLQEFLNAEISELKELIKDGDRELFEDILANTVSRKIRGKINASTTWVSKMNSLMNSMNTSSGLRLSLRWRSKTAENEDQLDTNELVELLKKDYRLMREDEAEKLSLHFRSKVEEARRNAQDSGGMVSFYQVMKETLDYRKWFEFQLFSQKNGERQKELTNSVFGTFSGGEKAMSMYVPLFSAVVAKYQGGREDAPRLISLDEAFAGVDNKNIRDMFRLMTEFKFDFIINSQVLWGDCDTLDALAIYQLIRPENAKFVTVMPYVWNGKTKEILEDEDAMERRSEGFTA